MKTSVVALLLIVGCAAGDDLPALSPSTVSPGGRASQPTHHYITPDGQDLPIQDVGLPVSLAASGVPPLGEGVAPIAGDGGDGAPVVTRVGVWSAGSVQWHGGQWVIPYGGTPDSTIANVSCDVVPRADVIALMELVGSTGVIGTTTIPAATGIVIRAWVLPTGGYAMHDGEHVTMRISPRDATTGAWTSAVQDVTVISCSVHTEMSIARTITIPPTSFTGTTWSFVVGPNAMQSATNGILVGGVPSHPGDTVQSFTIPVRGPVNSTIVAAVKIANNAMQETVIGSGQILLTSSWVPFVVDVVDTTVPSNGAVTMIFTASTAGVAVGNIAMHYIPGT